MPPGYCEFAPGAALEPIVECFWSHSAPASPAPASQSVLPDGCMDLLFDFQAEARPPVTIVGVMSRALVVDASGPSDLLGIRFRPGGLPALLGLDAAELRDRSAEPGCFGAGFALGLWDRLAAAPHGRRAAILRDAVKPAVVDPLVDWCVRRISAAGGAVTMSVLEEECGAGARRIERAFLRHVGTSPKGFARVARFRRLVAAADRGEGRWVELAADCGYSDQSHMIREFRSLAGLSPTAYFAGRAVGFVQDEGTSPA